MEVVKVDEKGRMLIPKELRERAGVKEGGYVKVTERKGSIVIQPLESVADKYLGTFEVKRWPQDLDEFVVGVMREWWTSKTT